MTTLMNNLVNRKKPRISPKFCPFSWYVVHRYHYWPKTMVPHPHDDLFLVWYKTIWISWFCIVYSKNRRDLCSCHPPLTFGHFCWAVLCVTQSLPAAWMLSWVKRLLGNAICVTVYTHTYVYKSHMHDVTYTHRKKGDITTTALRRGGQGGLRAEMMDWAGVQSHVPLKQFKPTPFFLRVPSSHALLTTSVVFLTSYIKFFTTFVFG